MLLLKIGSQTRARRAAQLLRDNGIKTTFARTSDDDGCAEGLLISRRDFPAAKALLSGAGTAIKSVSEYGGGNMR